MNAMPDVGRISSTQLSLEVDENGIAILSLHPDEGRPNLLTTPLLRSLDEQLDSIEQEIARGRVQALVVRSARPGTFLAGIDLDEVLQLRDAGEAAAQSRMGQRVLRRLERLAVPTVASIDGACVGAGLELALACGYRLASSARHTQLGLFHIRIGITPAFGGTVRLPRLIGLQAALDLILSGESLPARRAREIGLVDEVVSSETLHRRSLRFARQRAKRGRVRRGRRRVTLRLLEDTAPGRRLIFRRAARKLSASDAEPSPASRLVLEMLAEGVNLPLERAFHRESELAGRLLVSESARALVHAFQVGRSTRQLPGASTAPEHSAVLGAGDVGVEMTFALLSAGISVRLRDRRRETLGLGIRRVLSRIAELRLSDQITEEEADFRGSLLSAGRAYGGFGTLEIIVAAEGEGDSWVRAALAEAADHSSDSCILAFASPLLSATDIQADLPHPGRIIGLHPVLPAARFPLIEIAPGEATTAEVTAACVALVRRLGRAAVEVRAARATPATRLLCAYFAEALLLVEEGAGIAQVDRAAESFGFSMGPLRRMDAIGVLRSGRYLGHLSGLDAGESGSISPVFDEVASSGGFYTPDASGSPIPNPAVPAGLPEAGTRHLDPIRRRLLLRLVNEAAALLEEQAVRSPIDLELISLTALGFPRLRGGLLFHADRSGLDRLVHELEEHARLFGPRFAPSPLLSRLAQSGGGMLAGEVSSGQSEEGVL
jgi:3-hydroxyacyl-CoA dehydrogenase / enoyl-CoA hydratase / 3-hydroxybutyryl-CoA epimerase